MSQSSVGGVLAQGRWQGVEDRHLRARLMEERAARLEAEAARREEEKRAGKEAEVRAAAIRFGFVEYLPVGGESVERLEELKKTIWRKAYRQYPFLANPSLKAKELAWWQGKYEQWARDEEAKARMFEELEVRN